jgi:hypothetical protein
MGILQRCKIGACGLLPTGYTAATSPLFVLCVVDDAAQQVNDLVILTFVALFCLTAGHDHVPHDTV